MLAMWILFDGIRSSMMGMTIDDCISELTWVRKVNEEIIKTDAKEIDVNSAWIEHWKNVVKSLDVAIDTMRKYQKIQEIVAKWADSGARVRPLAARQGQARGDHAFQVGHG